MGAYLSSPNCEKETIQGSNDRLAFAASSMQGWRMSQEDAHNAILNYDNETSFFAVYDGHGGAEIALYCSQHLPEFLKQLDSYRTGQLNDALTEGFLKFDALLLEPNVKRILQELAESKDKNSQNNDDEEIDDDGEDEDEMPNGNQGHDSVIPKSSNEENHHNDELNVEEAHLLKKEAELPIEELLKRYGDDSKQVQSEDTEEKSDVLDHKTAEVTTTNGEISDRTESKPSSSEPKSTAKRARKPVSTETTTASTKSKSLTHHLLENSLNELDDDEDEDEDDFELEGSDDESSEENEDDYEDVEDTDEEEEEDGDDDDDEEKEEEEEEEKQADPKKSVRLKKLMRKSIMAILNRRSKKKKHGDDSEEDVQENQEDDDDDDEENEHGDEEEDEDEDDDDDGVDLSKVLDMSSDPGASSGCTAVVTLLRDKQLFVANAGDSRCVVSRGGRAIEMSIDHKPEDPEERTRIEKAGYKVTLDGRVSGGLNLSRAIGDHAYKKTTSLPAKEQAITALPDIRTLMLEDQDDFMVIACDGIWNFMSSQDVVDFVRIRLNKKSLSEICEELFMHCLAPNTSGDGTGCDNMTAIIVKFNFNNQSTNPTQNETVLSKSTELNSQSNATTKRALSPEHTSSDDNNKKLKAVSENGTSTTTVNNSNDE